MKRPKVWEPRAKSKPEVLPEWCVMWNDTDEGLFYGDVVMAKIAWQAHQQVKGAPAFGSCRVVRVAERQKDTENGH